MNFIRIHRVATPGERALARHAEHRQCALEHRHLGNIDVARTFARFAREALADWCRVKGIEIGQED